MQRVDLTNNRIIAHLTTLMRELERSRNPQDTINALQHGFAETGGFVASMLLSTRGLPDAQYRVVRMQLHDDSKSDVPILDPRIPGPVQSGEIVGEIIGCPQPQLIEDVDWSRDPQFRHVLEGYTSVMAMPFSGKHLPMNWIFMLKKPPDRFTTKELEEAVERLALGSALLENQILAEELARAHDRIDKEARQLGEVQRALLPASLPRIAGLEIAASYEPSSRAGGDLYDVFSLDQPPANPPDAKHRWCLFMGDTAGHGLPAAIVIAIVQAVLRAHPPDVATPASLLSHANRQLCGKGLYGFVTAFLGVYEPGVRRLTYANAGHPPPLLRRDSDGSIIALQEVASLPLGIDENEQFKEAATQLYQGDTVLLYTDGITEARHGTDFFGMDRLTQLLQDHGDQPARLIEQVRSAVRVHEQGVAPMDDQTALAARVL